MARRSPQRKPMNTSLPANRIIAVLNAPVASVPPSPEPSRASTSTVVGRKSTMRRSPKVEIPLPITYTPTTHRISKAKKGKRVHACEFQGCNKVFTRAEHRRRHELNHNPEASLPCTQVGCAKAFHRADLLARHMERHELESQTEQSEWASQSQTPAMREASIPRCMPVDAHALLGTAQLPSSITIEPTVGSGVHSELSSDCPLMWNGMDLPLQPRPSATMFQHHLSHTPDDSPFYSSPAETCPSPLSDATFPVPPHSSSSISSTSSPIVDQYPKTILNANVTSSPLPSTHRWDDSDSSKPPSHLGPVSLEENLIQAPVTSHYPSPSWSNTDCLPYDDQVHSLTHFQPMTWKQWAI